MLNRNQSKQAFTLVELLVVISIILIASSIIFIGGSGGDGAKLSSSQRILSGIAQGARGQAILKNAKTRLLIYTDDSQNPDHEKKLRFFGIVYEDSENPGQWIAATQGTNLPEGIYFNEDLTSNKTWTRRTMQLEFPRKSSQSPGSGDEYFYYEFLSNGNMSNEFDNSWLILQAGILKPGDGGALEVDFTDQDKQALVAGLIFRRTGTTTPVNDPIDIL